MTHSCNCLEIDLKAGNCISFSKTHFHRGAAHCFSAVVQESDTEMPTYSIRSSELSSNRIYKSIGTAIPTEAFNSIWAMNAVMVAVGPSLQGTGIFH